RLGFNSTELIEILDLRIDPDELTALIDEEKYFFGYHMNKRHWLTICLNGSVPTEEIFKRLDKSYELATKNSSNRLMASAASAIMVKPSKAPTVRA
ncbi:MAG: MmcQ/YjbR family DNA-binding protein, partial [Selenomonadaceae bacterium]|nr:MmcQ/YjbR family DNA-binding protein [Selenomonadaceae bacterium]